MNELRDWAERCRALSYRYFGKKIKFYIPGMFVYNGKRGKYPAVSLTGKSCARNCPHCQGKLLASMYPVEEPEELWSLSQRLAASGMKGVLLSGGFDDFHRLQWEKFAPVIREVKKSTQLKISIHCGIVDPKTAFLLKEINIDQALIDVIGSDETLKRIYNTKIGVDDIFKTIESLINAGLTVVPHIVIGIDYGRIIGEYQAIEILSRFPIKLLVLVSLMPIPSTEMESIRPPAFGTIAGIIAYARLKMPQVEMALGCARQRGNVMIERWALDCGINRLVLPDEKTINRAKEYGLEVIWKDTCCSI